MSPAGGDGGEDPRPPLWFLVPALLALWGILMGLAILPFDMADRPKAWGLISTVIFFATFLIAAAGANFLWFRAMPRDRIRKGLESFNGAIDRLSGHIDAGMTAMGVPLAIRAAVAGRLASFMFWGTVAALAVSAVWAVIGAARLFA